MVTDEMVEKAAEAYWMQVYGRHRKANKWPDDVYGSSQELFRDGCRAALEAALSTDAEPVTMDDEDRTPMPAGFDDALWRKADEVHHAMALVARDQECVKIIYAALSTHNAEPVKTAPAVAVKAIAPVDVYKVLAKFVDAEAFDKEHVSAISRAVASELSAQVPEIAGWETPQDRARVLSLARKLWDEDQYSCAWNEENREHYIIRAAMKLAYSAALSAQVQDVAEIAGGLKELQTWVFEQRVSLLPVDPDFHAKYDVWKSVGAKIRELSASPASKHGEAE